MSRSRFISMVVFSALSVCVSISTPAFAGPLHYYNANGVKLVEDSPLLIDATGGIQTLKIVLGGLPLEVTCTALDSHGKVENPAGGGAGNILTGLLYLGCTIAPSTLECKIPEGMISFGVNGVLEGTGAAPVVLFSPDPASSSLFVKIIFEKCKNAGLNTTFPIEGTFLGKISNSTSTVKMEEIKGSSSMLKFAGNEVGLVGTEAVEMTGGGKLEVKE